MVFRTDSDRQAQKPISNSLTLAANGPLKKCGCASKSLSLFYHLALDQTQICATEGTNALDHRGKLIKILYDGRETRATPWQEETPQSDPDKPYSRPIALKSDLRLAPRVCDRISRNVKASLDVGPICEECAILLEIWYEGCYLDAEKPEVIGQVIEFLLASVVPHGADTDKKQAFTHESPLPARPDVA
jgi:hypothetical protein